MHIAAGETSITYVINSYDVGHQVDIFCQSVHSSEALQASGYPKAITLLLHLQKSGVYLLILARFLLYNSSLRMFQLFFQQLQTDEDLLTVTKKGLFLLCK